MSLHRNALRALVFGIAVGGAASAQADDFTISGYATLGAGKVLSGDKRSYEGYNCPCYIANYPDAGVYTRSLSLNPDTRGGVQMTWRPLDSLSFTGQVTSVGANDFKPKIDWAYGSWNLTDSLTLQIGRKRLPLFGYSDFFDVGYAYPWIRTPGDLYGWQITAYNGANLLWHGKVAGLAINANVWVGNESDGNNRELGKLYYSGDRVEERWKGILGGYVEASNDWASLRFVVMTNQVDRYVTDAGKRAPNKQNVRQNFFGLTGNIDYGDIVVRTEANKFIRPDHPQDSFTVFLAGAGYRFGDWLPMLTYSTFKESYPDDETGVEKHHTISTSVRWDARTNLAVKLQYDIFTDTSGVAFPFVGNSRTIAVSVDYTF